MSGANSLLETGNMGFGKRAVFASDSLFSFSWKKRPFVFMAAFSGSCSAIRIKAKFQSGKVSKFQRPLDAQEL